MKDEGIVQPVSKEMEQLSRRLHQKVHVPRRNPGNVILIPDVPCDMKAAKAASPLSPESAAYIAGLVDGEGTITLSRLHANENRRLVVSIANTELPMLEYVLEQVGAGKITRKRTTSVFHTPSFCYAITGRQALTLLGQICPHLRTYKRKRAELALERYISLTSRNGKYTAAQRAEREKFESALLALKPTVGEATSL